MSVSSPDVIKAALERGLIHFMLILADADGFRVELHEFRQQIRQPAPMETSPWMVRSCVGNSSRATSDAE
jgi:hypothetical protein